MKKASKVLLIIAGVFGVLSTISLLLISVFALVIPVYGVALYIKAFIETIVALVQSNSNAVGQIISDSMGGTIDIVFGLIVVAVTLVFAILMVIGTVFAFLGASKNKKAFNVLNIVFGSLTIFPIIAIAPGVLFTLFVFLVLILLIVFVLMSAFGPVGVFTILSFIFFVTFMVLSILGGIFGLVANKKEVPMEEEVEEKEEEGEINENSL